MNEIKQRYIQAFRANQQTQLALGDVEDELRQHQVREVLKRLDDEPPEHWNLETHYRKALELALKVNKDPALCVPFDEGV